MPQIAPLNGQDSASRDTKPLPAGGGLFVGGSMTATVHRLSGGAAEHHDRRASFLAQVAQCYDAMADEGNEPTALVFAIMTDGGCFIVSHETTGTDMPSAYCYSSAAHMIQRATIQMLGPT